MKRFLHTIFSAAFNRFLRFNNQIAEWASRPRVRLIPFYFARTSGGIVPRIDRDELKTDTRRTYPCYTVENRFYTAIKHGPEFLVVQTRLLSGYFEVTTKGFEDPKADVIAIWYIPNYSPHPRKVCIFYVDDAFYAGDISYDSEQGSLYVRLLYKVKENVNIRPR